MRGVRAEQRCRVEAEGQSVSAWGRSAPRCASTFLSRSTGRSHSPELVRSRASSWVRRRAHVAVHEPRIDVLQPRAKGGDQDPSIATRDLHGQVPGVARTAGRLRRASGQTARTSAHAELLEQLAIRERAAMTRALFGWNERIRVQDWKRAVTFYPDPVGHLQILPPGRHAMEPSAGRVAGGLGVIGSALARVGRYRRCTPLVDVTASSGCGAMKAIRSPVPAAGPAASAPRSER
jgi:hypothetical protein